MNPTRWSVLLIIPLLPAAAVRSQAPPLAWEAFFDGTLPGLDEAHALIVAPDNTIYVTGASTNIAPQGTITTLRYATNGTQLWADHPYGPSQDSQNKGVDMAIDPWGHVYVCGNISNSNGDLAVIKYGGSGRIWRENFEQYPTADVPDEATGIAIDAAGDVYVSGYITSTSGMGLDNYTLKVDSAGNEVWNDDFALSSADEIATDIAVSPTGKIYVGGNWWNLTGDGGIDMSVVRFDASGTRIWDKGFEAPSFDDRVARVRAKADDGVLACGTRMGSSNMDAAIIAYDTDGVVLWDVLHAGTGNVDDDAVDVQELPDGRVAAVIHSRELVGGSLRHTITVMMIDDGDILWTEQYTGSATLGAWPTAMILDAHGDLLISGYETTQGGLTTDGLVMKYNASGSLVWSLPYDGGANQNDRFNAIGINTSGDVVACGTSHTSASASRYVTVQFGNAVGVNEDGSVVDASMVFPNPANDLVHVRTGCTTGMLEVFDALGNRVNVDPNARTVNVSTWPAGFYFIKLGTVAGVACSRFAVVH